MAPDSRYTTLPSEPGTAAGGGTGALDGGVNIQPFHLSSPFPDANPISTSTYPQLQPANPLRRRSSHQTHQSHTSLHLLISNKTGPSAPENQSFGTRLSLVLPRRPFKLLFVITTVVFAAILAAKRLNYIEEYSLHLPSNFDLKSIASSNLRDLHAAASLSQVATSSIPATCEPCIANPKDPLCKYGMNNIRLSRMYEGSGYRVRKVIEKAMRGERVSFGIIGASVSVGHGLRPPELNWHNIFFRDWEAIFPNTTVYNGAYPGMNSEFYSYCFDCFVPPTADLYFVELDVNNDYDEQTFGHDDSLYRGLLNLPHRPAVVRLSVFSMLFRNLNGGTPSGLTMSNYFDVPVIGIRNFLLPHILLHPKDDEAFFYKEGNGHVDTRHINANGHQALGDMLSLYFRKSICETRQELAHPLPPTEGLWPGEDILTIPPQQYLWTNHKSTDTASLLGADNAIKPGKAFCSVDGDKKSGKLVNAYIKSGFSHPQWTLLFHELTYGEHILTCEISSETSTGGHDFRLIGIGSQ
ncbi:hypothetical protein P7C70_g6533, partial [Phenoliferia sp. Uapishka_3]